LWLLPPGGGEARRIIAPPGGVTSLATAADAKLVAFVSPMLPGVMKASQDAQRRQARTDAGVTAILHESAQVRYWDHDLGPGELRLLLAEVGADEADDEPQPRDLTPEPGRALDERHYELTPDGRFAVTGWGVWDAEGNKREDLVVIDGATGERRTPVTSAPNSGDLHSGVVVDRAMGSVDSACCWSSRFRPRTRCCG
jgi:hypothetical protein